jgi:hypothetical protein
VRTEINAQPGRDFTRLSISIVVAAIVVSAALVSYSSFADTVTRTVTKTGGSRSSTGPSIATVTLVTSTVTRNATTPGRNSSGFDCEDAAVAGQPRSLPLITGNDSFSCERVLVIPPGSTMGTLVVSYWTDPSVPCPHSEGCTSIANLTADVLQPDWSPFVGTGGYSYVNATGVTITPSVPSVNVSAVGRTNITVTYTVRVSAGVRGFFELEYLNSCPEMVPLAVGYAPSQLNASSFPDYPPLPQECTQLGMLPGGELTSVTGIETAWLVQTVVGQQQQEQPTSAMASVTSQGTPTNAETSPTITSSSSTISIVTSSESTGICGGDLAGCAAADEPVVVNAFVNESSVTTDCGVVTQAYPEAVVCDLMVSGGASGTVTVNLASEGADSTVAFGLYSSDSRYVQYTPSPAYPCLYSSSPPDYGTDRCPVYRSGSTTYTFNYTVSQKLPAQWEEVALTIVVTKTCCWH